MLLLPVMSEMNSELNHPRNAESKLYFFFVLTEQQVNVTSALNSRKKPLKRRNFLKLVYGNKNLVRMSTKGGKYSEGRENFAVDARCWRLSTARNSPTVANFSEMIIRDHRMVLKLLAD